jgi:hypothetical protein
MPRLIPLEKRHMPCRFACVLLATELLPAALWYLPIR